jgi:type IV secretion system protein TrbJ
MKQKLSAITLGFVVALCGISASMAPSTANAIYCSNCSSELTQIINKAQLAQQYTKQLQQYQTQLQELNNQILNLRKLPQNMQNQYQQTFQQFKQQIQQTEGLMKDLAQVKASLDARYPDYTKKDPDFKNFTAMIDGWNNHERANLENALSSGAAVLQQMEGGTENINNIVTASQNAVGALQAAQASNQLQGILAGEMMKMNAQNAVMQQIELEERARAISANQANVKLRAKNNAGREGTKSTVKPVGNLGNNE